MNNGCKQSNTRHWKQKKLPKLKLDSCLNHSNPKTRKIALKLLHFTTDVAQTTSLFPEKLQWNLPEIMLSKQNMPTSGASVLNLILKHSGQSRNKCPQTVAHTPKHDEAGYDWTLQSFISVNDYLNNLQKRKNFEAPWACEHTICNSNILKGIIVDALENCLFHQKGFRFNQEK